MDGVCVLLLAAGRGQRFGEQANKILATVGGMPVVWWSLQAFHRHPEVDHVVLVARPVDREALQGMCSAFPKVRGVVDGGGERWESVYRGLQAIPAEDRWVLVHDAARPAVSVELISRVLQAARQTGAAIPALPVSDTLKWVDSGSQVKETLPRVREEGWRLVSIQTPQGFAVELLRQAYAHYDFSQSVPTDDASIVEQIHPVTTVPGDPRNLKLTYPEDLTRLEEVLIPPGETRSGIGYDVHPLVEGRRLVLGGVAIDSSRGLMGHSDADVVLHAIADALLGAAGMEDIGVLFPNTDPSYRDADSAMLLGEVWNRVHRQGWQVVNIDATVIAEAPRLRPYIAAMRERIAAILGVEATRVNLKATTNERMGFIGRGEGIACLAIASLRRAG